MKYQEQETWEKFSTRITGGVDSLIPKLLTCSEYVKYARGPFNDIKDNLLSMRYLHRQGRKKTKQSTPPCHLLSFDALTEVIHYDKKEKTRSIDPSHVNAYIVVPIFVHCITTKIKSLNIYNLAERDTGLELNIIKFLSRYGCGTRKYPSAQLHVAIKHYCSNVADTKYIQGLDGDYCFIPVTLFLVTLYNVSFTFDTDKSKNLLVSALERFDLSSTDGDDVFLNTLSKSISSASFSKLEIHAI
jgi:hypothetical protein